MSYRLKQAIRGGIPIVFPIFGTDPIIKLPQHGFARTSIWKFAGVTSDTSSAVTGVFELTQEKVDPSLLTIWPHKFKLIYTVTLAKDSLSTKFDVQNLDASAWEFEALLHNYIAVEDVTEIKIHGFKAATEFFDKGLPLGETKADYLQLNHETDRVHTFAEPVPIVIETGRKPKGTVKVAREGRTLENVVLWNPWASKSGKIADLGEGAWVNFLCVEPGAVDKKKVTLKAGDTWTAKQTISAS
ncbi:hypothetical protein HDU93_000053 [Gonapodya sp. JEL0774]|nr:hypothetical protein HDU93_000053 [Gonapodya sp. JEL0774]